MFQPARRPVAFDYNPQATEDHEDEPVQPAEKRRLPRGKRANYKPTALTWPFIVTQILILAIVLGLVVWAEKEMPDSDSTAIIDPVPTQAEPLRLRHVIEEVGGKGMERRQLSATMGGEDTTTVEGATTATVEHGATATLDDLTTATSDLPITTLVPDPTVTMVIVDEVTPSPSLVTVSSSDASSDAGTSQDGTAAVTPESSSAEPTQSSQDGSETITDPPLTTTASSDLVTSTPTETSSGDSASSTTSTDSEQSSETALTTTEGTTTDSDTTSETGSPTTSDSTGTATETATTESATDSATDSATVSSETGSLTSSATDSMVTGTTSSEESDSTWTSSSWPSNSTSDAQQRKNGIITLTDATATDTTVSKSTSIFTSNFTTTRFMTGGNFSSTTITIPETTSIFNTTLTFVTTTDVTITVGVSTVPESTIYFTPSTSEPPTLGESQPPSTTTDPYFPTSTGTNEDMTLSTPASYEYTVIPGTTIGTVTVVPTTVTSTTIFETSTEVPATTKTIAESYVPYLETGQTVITSVQTVIIQPPQTQQMKTQAPPPTTIVATKVEGGEVYTYVETFVAQTKVIEGGPVTQVVNTPPPQTIVSQVGGHVTTNYLVITPTYTTETAAFKVQSTVGGDSQTFVQTQAPQTIVTSKDGGLVTLVTTPPPQTQVTVVGGTLTTVPAFTAQTVGGESKTFVQTQPPQTIVTSKDGTLVTIVTTPPPETQVTVIGGTVTTVPVSTTSTGFQPITYQITTSIGGSSSVVVETQAPTKIVTTINGTPVTMDTTLPPRTYTTTFGGTLVTQTSVTTPTGSEPITLTFASTIGGTLTTIIQTFAPSTYVTDISGTLTTIISTPSPSTRLSTASLRTTTFTSTSTPGATTGTGTATDTVPPAQTSLIVTTKEFDLTSRMYFVATFLPPILAVSLVIPLRIIDLNAKLYQPFNTLAHSPALGHDALTLQFTGLMGFITPAITLLQGHPVPFITTLIVLSASLLVPLAVEAISLKLHGHCSLLSSRGCAAAIGVSTGANHALLGMTAFVIVLLCLLLFFLRDWVTGLNANPWNIAGIASLARNSDVAIRARGDGGLRREVGERVYGLGYYQDRDGREEYGLYLADESGRGLGGMESDGASMLSGEIPGVMATGKDGRRREKKLPFMTLLYPWRVVFMMYLAGLLVLIAYYDFTLVRQTGGTGEGFTRFHLFFDSHSFGIRFLFASMGVVITFCWQAFFVAVATIVPYHALASHSQSPSKSILISRPTNPFYGIYLSIKLRHTFYFLTSLSAILSEFLPILLSNIPHKLTQVLLPTLICTRISLSILAFMLLVMAASFFIRWPPMPVDPRSIAGALWYVCQSRMLDDFAGLSEMSSREREKRVEEMGKRYYFGELVGKERIGVDAVAGFGEGVVTAYLGHGRESGFMGRREEAGREQDPAPNDGVALLARRDDVTRAGTGYQAVSQPMGMAMFGRRDEDPAAGGMEDPPLSFSERMQVRSRERLL